MSQYDDKFFSIRNTTRMALCIALICVSAYIAIPVPFMAPLTMQTFALCLTALVLTPAQTAVVLVGYTLLGAVGLPVFAGGVDYACGTFATGMQLFLVRAAVSSSGSSSLTH